MKEKIRSMTNKNFSAYEIHLQTGLSIKEVYHYIRLNEEAKNRHKEAIAKQRIKDAV